jgi:hypothetical protein
VSSVPDLHPNNETNSKKTTNRIGRNFISKGFVQCKGIFIRF